MVTDILGVLEVDELIILRWILQNWELKVQT